MTSNLPRRGTITRLLFELICVRPGVSTKDLVLSTGRRGSSGNMSYINSCLNAIRRRELIENRSGPRTMGHWYLTDVGRDRALGECLVLDASPPKSAAYGAERRRPQPTGYRRRSRLDDTVVRMEQEARARDITYCGACGGPYEEHQKGSTCEKFVVK
jgi:hypothetical protein